MFYSTSQSKANELADKFIEVPYSGHALQLINRNTFLSNFNDLSEDKKKKIVIKVSGAKNQDIYIKHENSTNTLVTIPSNVIVWNFDNIDFNFLDRYVVRTYYANYKRVDIYAYKNNCEGGRSTTGDFHYFNPDPHNNINGFDARAYVNTKEEFIGKAITLKDT